MERPLNLLMRFTPDDTQPCSVCGGTGEFETQRATWAKCGHPRTPENTYTWTPGPKATSTQGYSCCRICRRARISESQKRKRERTRNARVDN